MAKKSFGKVKVKRIKPELSEIPEDCGYMKQFEHNIDMNSNGIMGECIESVSYTHLTLPTKA